jgi:hypothetical protein
LTSFDILAVPGNAAKDVTALQHAGFVMKAGVVIKSKK